MLDQENYDSELNPKRRMSINEAVKKSREKNKQSEQTKAQQRQAWEDEKAEMTSLIERLRQSNYQSRKACESQ